MRRDEVGKDNPGTITLNGGQGVVFTHVHIVENNGQLQPVITDASIKTTQ